MILFVTQYQLHLLTLAFGLGCIGTYLLFAKPASDRAWRVADLVWVLLGGLGAVTAVVAGIYKSDSSRLDRQIDIAYAAAQAFDHDAARFRLRFCDPAYDNDILVLCDKVDFLSASSAENADLPLFMAVTDRVSPLQSLNWRGNHDITQDMDDFDAHTFLIFTTLDSETDTAVTNMRRKVPTIAADFLIIARAYDDLIAQMQRLQDEWNLLKQNAYILFLQLIALCLVGFAAPFRLGKSIVDLRR